MQDFDTGPDLGCLLGNVICEPNGTLVGCRYIELFVYTEPFSDKPFFSHFTEFNKF